MMKNETMIQMMNQKNLTKKNLKKQLRIMALRGARSGCRKSLSVVADDHIGHSAKRHLDRRVWPLRCTHEGHRRGYYGITNHRRKGDP